MPAAGDAYCADRKLRQLLCNGDAVVDAVAAFNEFISRKADCYGIVGTCVSPYGSNYFFKESDAFGGLVSTVNVVAAVGFCRQKLGDQICLLYTSPSPRD